MRRAAALLAVLFVPLAVVAGVLLARGGPGAAAFAAGYAATLACASLALWAADMVETWWRARESAGGRHVG